eukprot:4724539-Pleurochrysis_carterae.AAC.5
MCPSGGGAVAHASDRVARTARDARAQLPAEPGRTVAAGGRGEEEAPAGAAAVVKPRSQDAETAQRQTEGVEESDSEWIPQERGEVSEARLR